MSRTIDDLREARVVVEQLIRKAHLEELVGPLAPADRSIDDLLLLEEGEEAEVDLVCSEGDTVATILVDLQKSTGGWQLGLRAWRLADNVSSV